MLDAEGIQLKLDETRFVCRRAAHWRLVQDGELEMVVDDRRAVLLRRQDRRRVSLGILHCRDYGPVDGDLSSEDG